MASSPVTPAALRHAGSADPDRSGTTFGNQMFAGHGLTALCGHCRAKIVLGVTPAKRHKVFGWICLHHKGATP